MRTVLTDDEYNTLSKLTKNMKIDNVIDIYSNKTKSGKNTDFFYDFEENKKLSLKKGLSILYDAIAYPLKHEGLDDHECEIMIDLFKEFGVIINNNGIIPLVKINEDVHKNVYNEYSGLVYNNKTQKYDRMFVTEIGEMVAEHRAKEAAENCNKYEPVLYDYDTTKVKIEVRECITTYGDWKLYGGKS